MSSILVINAAGRETRVALVENGGIAEFYLERKIDKGIVGNVYKGRVTRVLPGMQAAFVDIGEDKAAFLYVGDVLWDPDVTRHQFELTEGEHDDEVGEVPEEGDADVPAPPPSAPPAQADVAATTDASAATSASTAAPTGVEVVQAAVAQAQGVEQGSVEQVEPQASSAPAAAPEHAGGAPSGAEVVQAAVAAAPASSVEPGSTGEPVATEAAAPSAAPSSPRASAPEARAVPSQGSLDAPRSQAPRDVKLKDQRPPQNGHRERDRERHRKAEAPPRKLARIEDLLKVGQEVLVQVSKDPIGTKGARVTSHISIPGRHLVFMPTVDHVGISRRIGNEKERRRLREIVDRLRPAGTGFIVRTVAENVPSEKLEADIRFLIEVWNETVRKSEKNHRAGLMHPDLDLILRATRDLFAQDVEQLVIDDRDEYERVLGFVMAQDPALKERVKLHEGEEPIFDAFGIEEEIKRASARKVWLKSGGYLIMDQAEALTAIDVNSGRYVGKKNLEDTILKINTEAAKEIVYQLRIRNIGGIIICDFIDMEKQQNRDKVFKALQEALGRDKAKTNVLRISELGLVEMTRKRVRESLGRTLTEDCGYCSGQGLVKTAVTVAYEIFRELRRSGPAYKDPTLVVQCQTEVANVLQGAERDELRHLMDRYNKSIQVRAHPEYHREQYDIYARPVSGLELKVATSTIDFEVSGGPARRPPEQPRFEQRGGGGGGGGGGGRKNRNRDGRGGGNGGGGGGGGGGGPNRPRASAPGGPRRDDDVASGD